jgi:hypothetical protein
MCAAELKKSDTPVQTTPESLWRFFEDGCPTHPVWRLAQFEPVCNCYFHSNPFVWGNDSNGIDYVLFTLWLVRWDYQPASLEDLLSLADLYRQVRDARHKAKNRPREALAASEATSDPASFTWGADP